MRGREELPPTEREHAFTTLLRDLRDGPGQPAAVRRAGAWGLAQWRAPQDARGALFAAHTPDDADGRLAAIRFGVLERLAALAPQDGVPHVGLVANGDPSVGGWLSGVRIAAAQATPSNDGQAAGADEPVAPTQATESGDDLPAGAEEPGAPTRAPLPADAVPGGPLAHRRLTSVPLATDPDARATSPTRVVWDGGEGTAEVGMDVSWRSGLGFGSARVPLVELRSVHDDGARRSTWQPVLEEWRAWSALVCGLYAADRLALPALRAATIRRCLLEPLGGLLAGALDGRGAIELAVSRLDCADGVEPRSWANGREPRSVAFAWPAAHAMVLGAIDRLVAGAPSAPPPRSPAIGTWVEVWPDGAVGSSASGRVVAEPGRLARFRAVRRNSGWRSARASRRSDGPPVWVRVGDVDEPVPLGRIRLPRPSALFG